MRCVERPEARFEGVDHGARRDAAAEHFGGDLPRHSPGQDRSGVTRSKARRETQPGLAPHHHGDSNQAGARRLGIRTCRQRADT